MSGDGSGVMGEVCLWRVDGGVGELRGLNLGSEFCAASF